VAAATSSPRQLYTASDAGAALPEHDESGLREETEAFAAAAVAAYERAPEAEKSFGDEAGSRTDLAIARVRSGNLEGAREAVGPVLDLPVSLRDHGAVTSVLTCTAPSRHEPPTSRSPARSRKRSRPGLRRHVPGRAAPTP
jgi:hypothetical protein